MTRRPSRSRPPIDFESLRTMRVRSYVRESSPRQAEADRYGPDLQRKGISTFCDRWAIPHPEKEYFDASTGRRVDRRYALQHALEEADEYDALLMFHTSRSFRNRHDAAIWKTKFRQAGVQLVFTEQGIISGDPRYKIVEGFNELTDEISSDTQGMFIARGLRQKFEKGGVNGVPPLGYRRYHGLPGDEKNGSLIIDEQGRRTVRAIVELYLSGQQSAASIAMRLNAHLDEHGQPLHRTRLGLSLTKGSVEEVLRNRVYTGVTVWQPGTPEEEIRPGNHEPIITQDEWEAIERIRARRTTRRGRRPVGRVYPLSGPARCFECGASFAGDTGGRRGKRRLRHAVSVSCVNRRSFDMEELESQMAQLLTNRFCLPQDWSRGYLRAIARTPETDSTDGEAKRRRLEQARDNLRNLFIWGDIGEAQYRRQREEIDRQIAAVAPPKSPAILTDVRRAASLLQDIGALWSHPGVAPERRKEFIEEVFEEIQFDQYGIRVVLPRNEYKPLVALAEASRGGNGRGDWI